MLEFCVNALYRASLHNGCSISGKVNEKNGHVLIITKIKCQCPISGFITVEAWREDEDVLECVNALYRASLLTNEDGSKRRCKKETFEENYELSCQCPISGFITFLLWKKQLLFQMCVNALYRASLLAENLRQKIIGNC